MGAINYGTSDYITMGLKPYDIKDIMKDRDFLDFIKDELGIDTEYKNAVYNAACDEIQTYYENDIENIETELAKYNFYYYHVAIKSGYYEGFYIDIENNFSVCIDSWEDRRMMNKEITQIKQFLIDCAGLGLVQCSPGWCTGYNNYSGTIKAINAAVKKMREEVKIIPTWLQMSREERG